MCNMKLEGNIKRMLVWWPLWKARARGRRISMGRVHSQPRLHIKTSLMLYFFSNTLIFSLISWTSLWSLSVSFKSWVVRNLFGFFFHWRRTHTLDDRVRSRSNFYFFHILVFRSQRFVNKFPDNETERFVTSSRLVWIFSLWVVWTPRRSADRTI